MNEHDDIDVIRSLLASHLADGKKTSLYELVKWLQQPEQSIFNDEALKDSLLLFRCNFLIMHALYRLRLQWRSEQLGELLISALHIQLAPALTATTEQSDSTELEQADPLQVYYLDLNNLSTSREQVELLLEQFWKKMRRPDYSQHQDDDLAALELSAPVTAKQIRQQYRRLAMQHHPDRGGDSIRFRQINAAYQRLKQASFIA
ncbi:DNA-J related domain-containing protein [Bacterioplanoides sp.]|uniref:DNA-J related domain-containing protein n=1 Tax=Bacterioplanoides sp. TaxID=2066072 RepID=UPI003AFFCA68